MNVTKLEQCSFLEVLHVAQASSAIYYTALFSSIINGITSVFATVSNLTLLFIFVKTYQLHTPSNVLLASLSVTDLLVGFIVQPLSILRRMNEVKNRNLCTVRLVYTYFGFLCSGASFLMIGLISIDRFIAIYFPFRYTRFATCRLHMVIVLVIWLSWAVFTLLPLVDVLSIGTFFTTVVGVLALNTFIVLVAYALMFRVVLRQRRVIMTGDCLGEIGDDAVATVCALVTMNEPSKISTALQKSPTTSSRQAKQTSPSTADKVRCSPLLLSSAKQSFAQNYTAPDSSAPDGSAQDGPAPDGSAQDGSAQDGSARDGSARDGPASDGSGPDGSAGDGSARDDSARDRSAQDCSARDGPAPDISAPDDSAPDGSVPDGSARNCPNQSMHAPINVPTIQDGPSSTSLSFLSPAGRESSIMSRRRRRQPYKSEKRKTYTVGIVVICMIVCYIPQLTVLFLRGVFGDNINLVFIADAWVDTCTFMNSSLNPIIYCFRMKEIRYFLRKMFGYTENPRAATQTTRLPALDVK
eukprot:gene3613-4124_t